MATVSGIASSIASKTKTKKKHFVAQKVKLFRASDPLLSVLMWGVNHSINELSHVQIPVMLMPDDFKAYSKIKVDNHLFNKENMPSHFKFKEYCPMVFRNLRERFAIDDQDFQNSLTRSAPLTSDSQGRSGARFHMTYDKRYVIKTITSEDVAEMHNILKKYHQFIVECHGNTLLPQFLGMYRLTVDGDETYIVVTRNVFSHRLSVYRKYDLKGSTVAREASDKEKFHIRSLRIKGSSKESSSRARGSGDTCHSKSFNQAKELPTYKDNDFINDGQKIYIDENNKKMFLEKLKKDVECLGLVLLVYHRRSWCLLSAATVHGPAEAHGLQPAGGYPRRGEGRAGRDGVRGERGGGGRRERWHTPCGDPPGQPQQHPGQLQAHGPWGV
nr:PREDICTED: phosphatidylinositol 5-phosphate 4-kinase type-2 alpha isoform X5 [Lepisosteus oculatus]